MTVAICGSNSAVGSAQSAASRSRHRTPNTPTRPHDEQLSPQQQHLPKPVQRLLAGTHLNAHVHPQVLALPIKVLLEVSHLLPAIPAQAAVPRGPASVPSQHDARLTPACYHSVVWQRANFNRKQQHLVVKNSITAAWPAHTC